MKYIYPSVLEQFYCAGERCSAPCAAPVDMTWTQTLGPYCENGLSLACPEAAKCLLLHEAPLTFRQKSDGQAPAPLEGLTQEQLDLMWDARKTMDILLQNRELTFRERVVLAATYGAEFEPMITSSARYAYDEMDWGYTEQPMRQLTSAVHLLGRWELKRSDLINLLMDFHRLCSHDLVLANHMRETMRLFERLSGEEFRQLRDQFDAFMAPRDYLFENLMVYYVHRYFLAWAQEKTVVPGVRFLAVSFALLRAMACRVGKETGSRTVQARRARVGAYARCVEEDPAVFQALEQRFQESPLYSRERLQRLLWR